MSNQSKIYDYILALDPSGNYHEGKGTTGYCIIDNANKIITCGAISASDYHNQYDYWGAHITLLKDFKEKYENGVVVFEDYLLYASKANQHINSKMETPQFIGVLKMTLVTEQIPYAIQKASEVKTRWPDKILIWKNIIVLKGGHYYTPDNKAINRHTRDAIRHAVHLNTFKNRR